MCGLTASEKQRHRSARAPLRKFDHQSTELKNSNRGQDVNSVSQKKERWCGGLQQENVKTRSKWKSPRANTSKHMKVRNNHIHRTEPHRLVRAEMRRRMPRRVEVGSQVGLTSPCRGATGSLPHLRASSPASVLRPWAYVCLCFLCSASLSVKRVLSSPASLGWRAERPTLLAQLESSSPEKKTRGQPLPSAGFSCAGQP